MSRRLAPVLLLVTAVVLAGLWSAAAEPFARFRGAANDPVFPRGELDASVAVVAVDEAALADVGEAWPWSRATLAQLVDAISDAEPAAIVLDVLLAGTTPDDGELVRALGAAGNVVLATGPVDLRSGGDGRPLVTSGLVEPPEALARAAAAVGSGVALPDDADGVLRRSPLAVEAPDGQIVPALAVAAVAVARGEDPSPVLRRPSGLQVGGETWPTDGWYRLAISWPSSLAARVGAGEVLAGDVASLRGRVVYVGATAAGLGDRWVTPVDRVAGTPGVLTHAALHHTLVSRELLLPASGAEVAVWLLVLALVLVLATRFLPLWAAVVVDLGAVVVALVAAYSRSGAGVQIDVLDLVVVPVLGIPLAGALRYVDETRRRRFVTELFARYVPAPVARELVRRRDLDDVVAGQRVSVSVLFCDLRGFTPVAATLAPGEVNRLLRSFYEHVSVAVQEHRGTIVQFVGDEVFAVFGAPLPERDHAAAAVDAARALLSSHDALAATLQSDGLPGVGYGVGVHTGEVVAAHVGTPGRRQYAVVGDPVNVGSRLCGLAGAGEVVVSSTTWSAAGAESSVGVAFDADLKGIDQPVAARRLS